MSGLSDHLLAVACVANHPDDSPCLPFGTVDIVRAETDYAIAFALCASRIDICTVTTVESPDAPPNQSYERLDYYYPLENKYTTQ
jgi:hypothetical protein